MASLRGVFDVVGDPAGAGELAGVGLGEEKALVEMPAVAVENIAGHGGDGSGPAGELAGAVVGEAGQAGHDAGAVHQGQAFLGAKLDGLEAGGFGKASAAGMTWPSKETSRSPIRTAAM